MNATLKTKIAKLDAQIAKLDAETDVLVGQRNSLQIQLDSVFDPSRVVIGDTVTFTFGRGEKKVTQTGLVIGAKDQKFRVAIGTGFEATVVTVDGDKIVGMVKTA